MSDGDQVGFSDSVRVGVATSGNLQLRGTIAGEALFARQLDEQRARIKERVLRVLSEAADEVRDEARTSAPSRSGLLRQSIYARAWVSGDRVEARVAVRKKAYYGRFLELGFARQTVGVKEYVRGNNAKHTRKVSRRIRKAFGRQWRKAWRGGLMDAYAPVIVKAHTREFEVKRQTFFDAPARRVSALIPDRIRAAVDRALELQAASAAYDVPR